MLSLNQSHGHLLIILLASCFSGRIRRALQAHPSVPGQFFYVVGSTPIAVFDVGRPATRLGTCLIRILSIAGLLAASGTGSECTIAAG